MKVGDVIENPYVSKKRSDGSLNTMWHTIVIAKSLDCIRTIDYEGKCHSFFDANEWRVVKHIDFLPLIKEEK